VKCPTCGADYGRSQASHDHEFAWLAEAWRNLPEHLADIYPSPEHLRKRALIEAGWCTETVVDCSTAAAALRMAAIVPALDEFAYAVVRGPILTIRRAKSQSRRAMGAADFQKSKSDILDVVSRLIGVTPDALERAGRAA
jgi:hypothetical protein